MKSQIKSYVRQFRLAHWFKAQAFLVREDVTTKKRMLGVLLKSKGQPADKLAVASSILLSKPLGTLDKLEKLVTSKFAQSPELSTHILFDRIPLHISKKKDKAFVSLCANEILRKGSGSHKTIFRGLVGTDYRVESAEISSQIKSRHLNESGGQRADAEFNGILDQGLIYDFGSLLSRAQVNDIHAYLADKKMADKHFNNLGRSDYSFDDLYSKEKGGRSHYGSYLLDTTLKCPHLFDLIMNDSIIDKVSGYLKTVPSLSAINLFWTFPSDLPGNVSVFHRDMNDLKAVSVFTFLTDVEGKNDGAHQHIDKTSNMDFVRGRLRSRFPGLGHLAPKRVNWPIPFEMVFNGGELQTVIGEAGKTFCKENCGFHRSVTPTTKPRLVLHTVYTILPSIEDLPYRGKFGVPLTAETRSRKEQVFRDLIG